MASGMSMILNRSKSMNFRWEGLETTSDLAEKSMFGPERQKKYFLLKNASKSMWALMMESCKKKSEIDANNSEMQI